jgi:hypothetical protein
MRTDQRCYGVSAPACPILWTGREKRTAARNKSHVLTRIYFFSAVSLFQFGDW